MDDNVVFPPQFHKPRKTIFSDVPESVMLNLRSPFGIEHCAAAREMLGWSVEALAFRSGVTIKAIMDFESGKRQLRQVSLQALAFAMEAEDLIFIPKQAPFTSDCFGGATQDPRQRSDYHLIE